MKMKINLRSKQKMRKSLKHAIVCSVFFLIITISAQFTFTLSLHHMAVRCGPNPQKTESQSDSTVTLKYNKIQIHTHERRSHGIGL